VTGFGCHVFKQKAWKMCVLIRGKSNFLRLADAAVPDFDALQLTRSASELANHVNSRKSSIIEADHPVDVD